MKRRMLGTLGFAGLVVVSTACGISKETHQATLDALTKCQEEHTACVATSDERAKELENERAGRGKAEKELAALRTDLKATQQDLDDLRRQREETEKRLAAFRALTAKFQKMIDTGKIQVYTRGGRMIVNLPSGVLFSSGSASLSAEGKTAIAEVAGILKEFADRRFLVAGHTDNVPMRNHKFKDNWELSSARALTVTKYLISTGMDPKNLGAAGYAENDPVGDNATEEGKTANRRIEIILQPNIEELPKIPEA